MHKQSRRNSPEAVRELRMINHKVKNNGKMNDLKRRMGKIHIALIEPLVLKKKKPRVIRSIPVKEGMADNTILLSANALADRVEKYMKNNPNWHETNGTYDPIYDRVLDVFIPEHAMRLQKMYGVGNGKIAFNSVTDTRGGPNKDVSILRSQLNEIEQSGGIPSVGIFNGSLEATRILSPITDQEALDDLPEHQRSTSILDANTELRILDSPKFRES